MTYDQALSYIRSDKKFGKENKLERFSKLLNALGNPQNQLKFIHVAGTNGKGSTVTMTANILQNSGLKVGKFISPFVYEFGERISINNQYISPEAVFKYMKKIENAVIDADLLENHPGEFETITAIAFMYFAEEKCDIVCLEVGIGGGRDCTNVISSPVLSVITKIAYDHTELLGDTLTEIASDKCQIIKQSQTVSYCLQDDETNKVLAKYDVTFANLDKLSIKSCDLVGSEIVYEGKSYKISLIGEHQIYNALTVIEICKKLRNLGYNISDSDLENGLANTKFYSRMEIISQKPLVIVDGAHNLDGILALENNLKHMFVGKNVLLIMGMVKEKDYIHSVETISKYCKNAIFINLQNPRCADYTELMKYAKSDNIFGFTTLKQAIEHSKMINYDIILACGSLYLAQDIKKFF